ncbi:MAG TPA: DUF3141 domain-containing protein, partial [Quisquiliibacterium sp.]|nr:DUF3141 domain-containing protein [Quisquiliibacterium sp.]
GLLHENIGHLGIFVSGSVATREHAQIVSVLESIEALPPGLYGMKISERAGADGKPEYDVEFVERELEEVVKRLNRFEREDEEPFENVAKISDFNQRAYELFAQPFVRSMSNDAIAQATRLTHPLRLERWSVSDLNPWLWWLGAAADAVKANRQPVDDGQVFARAEKLGATLVSAGWDLYRNLRDAASEAVFLDVYGGLFALNVSDAGAAHGEAAPEGADRRDTELVREVLARIEDGGYPAAVARTVYLLARRGQPISLERIEAKAELIREYRELLPALSPDQARRIRGEQEIIVNFEPRMAVETLPALLSDPEDRARYLTLFERLLSDPRVQATEPTARQREMLEKLRLELAPEALQPAAPESPQPAPARRPARVSGTRTSSRRAR